VKETRVKREVWIRLSNTILFFKRNPMKKICGMCKCKVLKWTTQVNSEKLTVCTVTLIRIQLVHWKWKCGSKPKENL
jgi:hypothetical protein